MPRTIVTADEAALFGEAAALLRRLSDVAYAAAQRRENWLSGRPGGRYIPNARLSSAASSAKLLAKAFADLSPSQP